MTVISKIKTKNGHDLDIDWIAYVIAAIFIGLFGVLFFASFLGNTVVDTQMEKNPQFCKDEAKQKMALPVMGTFFELTYKNRCKQYESGSISVRK